MRLSDIKGDRVFDVMADIIEPIANIAQDSELVSNLFAKVKPPEDIAKDKDALNKFARENLVERLRKYAPVLLKSHKGDIKLILALIEGKSVDEYESTLTLPSLIAGLIELFTDDVFQGVFFSLKTEQTSGSTSATTTE